MPRPLDITPPFFEIGPKAYTYGQAMVDIAEQSGALGRLHGVEIIITPQCVDIPLITRRVDDVFVFAQHMDPLEPGRGVGAVLPEAIKSAGAAGVLLSHSERRLSPDVLSRTIRRARDIGLATMVCADGIADAVSIAEHAPEIIIVESPDMIAGGKRHEEDRRAITAANEAIWAVDPSIRVLHGAGINNAQDVYDVIAAGAQGTGSSSAIFTASDPMAVLEEMIGSVRAAWDQTH